MIGLKKVSESYAELVVRGLISREEAPGVVLVAALLSTVDDPGLVVPVEQLIDVAGLDRDELEIQFEMLSKRGIAVQRVGTSGYRLVGGLGDLLVPEAVVPQLLDRRDSTSAQTVAGARTVSVGLPYMYEPRCESTNQWLKSEGARLPSGAVAVTDDQTQGRGRLGRSWSSEPGKDLTFSVLLLPSALAYEATLLSLTAGLAVVEVLERLPGLHGRVRIKWPNDILIDDRKVCGILLESSSQGAGLQWIVIGIGLNVNSDPASRLEGLRPSEKETWRGRPLPTSLKAESGESVERGTLMVDLIAGLTTHCLETHISESLDELRSRDALLGRRVEVFAGPPDGSLMVRGEAMGIDDRGELLVRSVDGRIESVSAGEVTVGVDSLTT